MIKIYRKTANIKAEQFDGSDEMIEKYGIEVVEGVADKYGIEMVDRDYAEDYSIPEAGSAPYVRYFLTRFDLAKGISVGDWIATGSNGNHWTIADDLFKKTYAELPVIPKEVADWIEKCKNDGTSVGDMLCSERRPEKMRDWMALTPGTYEFNQRRYKEHQELVARAWLDGFQTED